MIWGSTREGALSQGGGAVSGDVYAMYFTKAAYDRSKLSKEEFALVKEQEDKDKKEGRRKKRRRETKTAGTDAESRRQEARSDRLGRPDGPKDAADDQHIGRVRLGAFEGRRKAVLPDRLRKGQRSLGDRNANPRDEVIRQARCQQRRRWSCRRTASSSSCSPTARPMKVDAESGKSEPIGVNTEMVLNYSAEKAYIFDHAWRQFKEKLIFPDLAGVDWDTYYTTYKRFLPYINNNYDFAEMLSEMLGEMNVSHTGCYYRAGSSERGRRPRRSACFTTIATRGNGVKIAEVIEGGPVDKAASTIKAGKYHREDRRNDDRRLDGFLQAAQPQGRQVHAAFGVRSGDEQTLGGDRQADHRRRRRRAVVQALGRQRRAEVESFPAARSVTFTCAR